MTRAHLCLSLLLGFGFSALASEDPWFGTPPDLKAIHQSKHISIVFAGENPRSPVSLFGHTFLVFHDAPEPEPSSVVIEYLATSPKGLVETLAGAFATIPGRFHITRFLYKKREYDLEDRDLWVYTLSNKKVRREKIASRLEQFSGKTVRYNFFLSNCSLHVLNLLVGEGEASSSNPLYTIPIATVQGLQRHGWVVSSRFIPSTLSRLNHSAARLSRAEKNQIERLLNGYAMPRALNPNASPEFIETLALAINYRLPREARSDTRSHLFSLKRKHRASMEGTPKAAPSSDRRIGYAQLAFNPADPLISLTLRPAFQDFYSFLPGPLDFSTLDLLRVQLATDLTSVALTELNVVRMESLIPSRFLSSGFVRYIDLSFHNWGFLHGARSEAALRLGLGWSTKLPYGLQFAVVPFVGARVYDDSSLRPGAALAVRAHLQLELLPRTRLRALYQYEPFSPLGFNHLMQLQVVPYETTRWGLMGALSFLAPSQINVRATAGITLFL